MDYKELGNRVREARTIYGITQSNLAERVGCSVQHISHIETGHTKASLPLLVKIANGTSDCRRTSEETWRYGRIL